MCVFSKKINQTFFFLTLQVKVFITNKSFWKAIKPFLTNKGWFENSDIISDHYIKIVERSSDIEPRQNLILDQAKKMES